MSVAATLLFFLMVIPDLFGKNFIGILAALSVLVAPFAVLGVALVFWARRIEAASKALPTAPTQWASIYRYRVLVWVAFGALVPEALHVASRVLFHRPFSEQLQNSATAATACLILFLLAKMGIWPDRFDPKPVENS